MPGGPQAEMNCPTCGARQAWRDTCRRCKCDLRLLCAGSSAYEQHRRRCLENLVGGTPGTALHHAKCCHSLGPGDESRRLLALCQLDLENWADALRAARVELESEDRPAQ